MRNGIGFSLLLLAAIGSAYLARSMQDIKGDESRSQMMRSGFYLKSARILGTADDRRLLYEINAKLAEQQNNNEVEFQDGAIHYTSEAAVPWVLNSDSALVANDRNHIILMQPCCRDQYRGFFGRGNRNSHSAT